MSTVHTTSVRFIRSGQNAISVMLSQDNIVHHKSPYLANYQIYINLLDGANKILASDYEVTYANAPDSIQIAGGYVDDYTHGLDVIIASQTEVNGVITLNVLYKGIIYSKTIHITTIVDGLNGDKGERGALLRGPQNWTDLDVGYKFYCGADGEPYVDTVLYKDNCFLCTKSHTKTSRNPPTSTIDNGQGLWTLSDKVAMVAAMVILAKYTCIKNLGAEAIEMKNSDGELVFFAKGGNVTCKTGTFENVNVSGIIKANLMYSSVRMLSEQNPGSSTYNIDPVNAPANTYFANIAFTHTKFVYLPDAVAYEGLELNFYQIALTNNGLGTLYIAAVNSQKIYYNTVAKLIDDNIIPVKLPIVASDTRVKPSPNEVIRIKAMAGAWYVMTGLVTEE